MADIAKAVKVVGGKETFAADFVKSDTDKQVWLGSPHLDNLVTVSIAIGAEIWALKQRQIISEKLAEKNMPATNAAIEGYKPTKEEEAEWETERRGLAKRMYGVLAREVNVPPQAAK
jgi:hypothetical protein